VYSWMGYVLLAQAVAAAAGESLRAVAARRIFEPLGMTDSFFRDHPDPLPDRGRPRPLPCDDRGLHVGARSVPTRSGRAACGTTLDDLARWDANLTEDRLTDGWLPRQLLTRGPCRTGPRSTTPGGVWVRTHRGLPT